MNYQHEPSTLPPQSDTPLDIKTLIKTSKQKPAAEQLAFIEQCYSPETQIFKKTFYNLGMQPVTLNYREIEKRQSIQKDAIHNLNESILYLQKRSSELKLRMKAVDQKLNLVKRKIMSLFKGRYVKNRIDEFEYWHVNNKESAADVLQELRKVSINLLEDIKKEKRDKRGFDV